MPTNLVALLVEDDLHSLNQYQQVLPKEFAEHDVTIQYDPCSSFEEADARMKRERFDLLLTDTYRGSYTGKAGSVPAALTLIRYLREREKFCPVVVFSSGPMPDGFVEHDPFIRWVDKTEVDGLERAIEDIVKTRVPTIARELHDELDRQTGKYLWGFLLEKWSDITAQLDTNHTLIERILRRRAAHQLNERSFSTLGGEDVPADYYIYPPPREDLSLGEILRSHQQRDTFVVVLTPHCYLTSQNGKPPRADKVMVTSGHPCRDVISADPDLGKWLANADSSKLLRGISKATSSPAQVGSPRGRYWYLPRFVEIPHLYCDLLDVSSVKREELLHDYDRVAVLASPYAEALQSCFLGLNGAVGLPGLIGTSVNDIHK